MKRVATLATYVVASVSLGTAGWFMLAWGSALGRACAEEDVTCMTMLPPVGLMLMIAAVLLPFFAWARVCRPEGVHRET